MHMSNGKQKVIKKVFQEWKWLFQYIRKYWWAVAAYIVVGVVATLMGLGANVASKYLIDAVINRTESRLLSSAVLVVGLAVMQIVFQSISSIAISKIGTRVNMEMRADFFERITSTTWENIRGYHSGELINRLEGDITTVSSGIINFIPTLITKVTQFLGAAIIVFYYDKTMAVLSLLGSPILMLTSNYMMKKIRVFNEKARTMNGKIISSGEETFQNIQMVKGFGLTDRYVKNFKLLLEQFRNVRVEYDRFAALTTMIMSFVGLLVSYSCYGWGVWRLWHGAITYGTLTMFIQLSSSLTSSFSSLTTLAPSIISIGTAAGRIMEITQLPEEVDDKVTEAEEMLDKASKGKIRIVAKNLGFTYSDADEPVIHNAEFTISSGETIAITGHSGEGKTTALRLLLGLVTPTVGELYFESDDGKALEPCFSTRRLCSYVPQINSVLYGTIAENLRAVKPDATDEELIEVLKVADIWDFVSSLPDGLNSHIGERNNNLSEGQAQRISIARAILRNAPILLMDEATSSLDTDTETVVLKNIMNTDSNRICILTTHRPSMLKYCTRIYKISEDGSFELCDNKDNK